MKILTEIEQALGKILREESYVEPTIACGPADEVVGVATAVRLKGLYTLWINEKLRASILSDWPGALAASNHADYSVQVLTAIFGAALRDFVDRWDTQRIGLREGWKIVVEAAQEPKKETIQ